MFKQVRELFIIFFQNINHLLISQFTGFKYSLTAKRPSNLKHDLVAATDKAVCMLANNTAIRHVWMRLNKKFEGLYQRKAFVHHYLEAGMEEVDLTEALENLQTLVQDYEEFETGRKDEEKTDEAAAEPAADAAKE